MWVPVVSRAGVPVDSSIAMAQTFMAQTMPGKLSRARF
jgi:hypothetical protein